MDFAFVWQKRKTKMDFGVRIDLAKTKTKLILFLQEKKSEPTLLGLWTWLWQKTKTDFVLIWKTQYQNQRAFGFDIARKSCVFDVGLRKNKTNRGFKSKLALDLVLKTKSTLGCTPPKILAASIFGGRQKHFFFFGGVHGASKNWTSHKSMVTLSPISCQNAFFNIIFKKSFRGMYFLQRPWHFSWIFEDHFLASVFVLAAAKTFPFFFLAVYNLENTSSNHTHPDVPKHILNRNRH